MQLGSLIKSLHIQTAVETVPRQSEVVLSSERKPESCVAGMHNKKSAYSSSFFVLDYISHFIGGSHLSHL